MIKYVAGFYFDNFYEKLLLIQKKRPQWQAGLYNAIGGKIESDETPEQAMRREFLEETGIDCDRWDKVCVLRGNDWIVNFFVANGAIEQAQSMTDEEVSAFPISELPESLIPNLRWLIPMAIELDDVVYDIHVSANYVG